MFLIVQSHGCLLSLLFSNRFRIPTIKVYILSKVQIIQQYILPFATFTFPQLHDDTPRSLRSTSSSVSHGSNYQLCSSLHIEISHTSTMISDFNPFVACHFDIKQPFRFGPGRKLSWHH